MAALRKLCGQSRPFLSVRHRRACAIAARTVGCGGSRAARVREAPRVLGARQGRVVERVRALACAPSDASARHGVVHVEVLLGGIDVEHAAVDILRRRARVAERGQRR
eukprot:170979-Pleurochrysis_carterae.AAC.3